VGNLDPRTSFLFLLYDVVQISVRERIHAGDENGFVGYMVDVIDIFMTGEISLN